MDTIDAPAHAGTPAHSGDAVELTARLIDGFTRMSEAAEAALEQSVARGDAQLDQWVAVCLGVRAWALADPAEYALLWGRPIPGYEAPAETMAIGARTIVALLTPVRSSIADGSLDVASADELPAELASTVTTLRAGLLSGLEAPTVGRMVTAWTQLHGMVGFEAYHHIAGVADNPEGYFRYGARSMGRFVGLPEGGDEG